MKGFNFLILILSFYKNLFRYNLNRFISGRIFHQTRTSDMKSACVCNNESCCFGQELSLGQWLLFHSNPFSYWTNVDNFHSMSFPVSSFLCQPFRGLWFCPSLVQLHGPESRRDLFPESYTYRNEIETNRHATFSQGNTSSIVRFLPEEYSAETPS